MKKLSSTDLEMSRSIKEHSVRIMAVIKLYVDNIQHLDRIEPNIEALGQSHFERGIKSEYLDVLGPVFAHTIRPLLVKRELWSLNLEEVWLAVFKNISELMKRGYPKDKRKTSKFLK